jgi:transposase InsO family protein
MALLRVTPKLDCIFHSDQGIEYAAHEYRELVESVGMKRSMSRKGTPIDNAAMEYENCVHEKCPRKWCKITNAIQKMPR